MNIADELRKLADQIEGNSLNTIEEKNIQKELYSEFLIRLKMIEEHLEKKRGQSKDLDIAFTKRFIDDYELRIVRLK